MVCPAFFALMIPFWSTVATDVFFETHCGILFEDTLASKVNFSPVFKVIDVLLNFITGGFTVTSHVFLIPSTVALIIAVPCLTAVTQPLSSTVAMLDLLVFHIGVIPDDISAVMVLDCPLYIVKEENPNFMVGFLTFTLHCAVDVSAFTVIIASPGLFPVILPLSSTVATLDLLLLKIISPFVEVVTFSLNVSLCSIEIVFLDKTIFVLETVILQLISVRLSFTLILHVPGDLAVTSPSDVTAAILLLVLLKVGIPPFEEMAAR